MSVSSTALISHISRGSLHDGAGIRTVVYFMGCGLRCAWCHNPETFTASPTLMHHPVKCIGCGLCVRVCPAHHLLRDGETVLIREGCTVCGKCAEACPTGALSLCGEAMTAEDVMKIVRKDRHYYDESGGGVTLSGGECLLHPDFCADLLRTCREEGIHTTLESALFVPTENLTGVLPLADHLFADVKLPDGERHKQWTGQDNGLILRNLAVALSSGVPVTVRIPLIPTVNDAPADMDAFASLLNGLGVERVELLRYNYLAESKYASLGQAYTSFGDAAQSDARMALLAERLRAGAPGSSVSYR